MGSVTVVLVTRCEELSPGQTWRPRVRLTRWVGDPRLPEHLQEIFSEDNIILWVSNLCPSVSVRWCFIGLVW